jgi:hypothetical protein
VCQPRLGSLARARSFGHRLVGPTRQAHPLPTTSAQRAVNAELRARARSDIPARSPPLTSRSRAFLGKPVSLTLCPALSALSPPAAAESIAASLLQPARSPRVIRVAASLVDSTFLGIKPVLHPYRLPP